MKLRLLFVLAFGALGTRGEIASVTEAEEAGYDEPLPTPALAPAPRERVHLSWVGQEPQKPMYRND